MYYLLFYENCTVALSLPKLLCRNTKFFNIKIFIIIYNLFIYNLIIMYIFTLTLYL